MYYLLPGEKVEWKLANNEYMSRLDEDAEVAIFVYGDVKNTHQYFSDLETFSVDKPDIEIQVSNFSALTTSSQGNSVPGSLTA